MSRLATRSARRRPLPCREAPLGRCLCLPPGCPVSESLTSSRSPHRRCGVLGTHRPAPRAGRQVAGVVLDASVPVCLLRGGPRLHPQVNRPPRQFEPVLCRQHPHSQADRLRGREVNGHQRVSWAENLEEVGMASEGSSSPLNLSSLPLQVSLAVPKRRQTLGSLLLSWQLKCWCFASQRAAICIRLGW